MNPNEKLDKLYDFLKAKKSETYELIKNNLDNPQKLESIESDLAHYRMLTELVTKTKDLFRGLENL